MQRCEDGEGEGGVQGEEGAGGGEGTRAFQPPQPALVVIVIETSASVRARPESVERHHGPLAPRQQRGLGKDAAQEGEDQTHLMKRTKKRGKGGRKGGVKKGREKG